MRDHLEAADFHLPLDIPGHPGITATSATLEHGQTRYRVHGPHIRRGSTLIAVPDLPPERQLHPTTIHIRFGSGSDPVKAFTPRPDEPVLYGVRIHGATDSVRPDTVSTDSYFLTHAVVLGDNFETRRIPDGARSLTEALVVAVTRHWQKRPDREDLLHAFVSHRAADLAASARRKAEQLARELADIRAEREATRHRSSKITGLLRRRQPPTDRPHPTPVELPLQADDGTALGTLTVTELDVSPLTGRVVYKVSGPRIQEGAVTLSPNIYGPALIPDGFYACFGRPTTPDPHTKQRTDMPTINGLTVHGGWSNPNSNVTPARPATSRAQVVPAPGPSTLAPAATRRRASALLRTVAVHYLSRPDISALRVAAGKQHAHHRRLQTTRDLAWLRRRETELARDLRHCRIRHEHFASLSE